MAPLVSAGERVPISLRPPQLGFSRFDAKEVVAFTKGDPDAVAEYVDDARELAGALASERGDEARTELVAKMLAGTRAQQRALDVLLGQTLSQRDEAGFRLVDRALFRVNQRMEVLLRALALESSLKRRPMVFVGHADSVYLGEEKR
jgi:hypothetical protein